ncbi:MAG: hypothetical protein ASARMPRED_000320 [Alectoria sarmentosa]|nr:MAG: hypothetical protein ASARMPRED_000320 [Alectoria sarmentosa]
MQIYTSDKTSARSFPWLWYLRLVALIFTFIVLGITASNSATFHSIGCDAPGKLSYNLAVSILSLIALFYFILASGPSRITRTLPWFIWGQLALDALMFIFWLSAGATSSYSCTDLCNACGIIDGYVYFDSESCECSTLFFKRDSSPRPVNVLQPRRSISGGGSTDSTGGGSIAAKQAFDAIMTVLFAVFIAADFFWIINSRRSGTTTASAPTIGAPMNNEEAGMPVGGGGAPIYTPKPGSEYNNQLDPRGAYTGQSTQSQGGSPQQPMSQEPYSGGQYSQGQAQYSSQTSYPQDQQIPLQTYPSPQGEYPPQYGGPVPQQTSYPEPPNGVSEMHSPTEVSKTNHV